MRGYSENIYYYPENSGLEIVRSVDNAGSWEFNLVVVFRDVETNQYLIGSDSGCSCPSPFEDIDPEDLVAVVTLADVADYARTVAGFSESDVADLVGGLSLN